MHYKNGREAKAGDVVVNLTQKVSGILHSTNPGSTACNGRLATISGNDPWVTIGECLHIDDIAAADIPAPASFATINTSGKPAAVPETTAKEEAQIPQAPAQSPAITPAKPQAEAKPDNAA